jgi:preprotein translocase subunit SecD
VRGFAFTLGLSTILDLAVVFLFTHPMVSLLSRMSGFGSARFTGLDALRGTPAPAAPAPRRSRPAAAESEAGGGGTAVLVETEEDEEPAVIDEHAEEPAPRHDTEADERPRRKTAPEPGSAAERAAARRARMRAERDEKGES